LFLPTPPLVTDGRRLFRAVDASGKRTSLLRLSTIMRGVKKQHLPEKICVACGRPFAWRKKWERDWEQVKFCSDACRRGPRRG
jgi:hypothetical protein